MKNKVWLITTNETDYDTYDGFVVIAKTKEAAIAVVSKNFYGGGSWERLLKEITCIGDSSLPEHSVLGSFNAG